MARVFETYFHGRTIRVLAIAKTKRQLGAAPISRWREKRDMQRNCAWGKDKGTALQCRLVAAFKEMRAQARTSFDGGSRQRKSAPADLGRPSDRSLSGGQSPASPTSLSVAGNPFRSSRVSDWKTDSYRHAIRGCFRLSRTRQPKAAAEASAESPCAVRPQGGRGCPRPEGCGDAVSKVMEARP